MNKYYLSIICFLLIVGFAKHSDAQFANFVSEQLASDPDNGECLTTDGSVNIWSSSCGSGGGGGGAGLWEYISASSELVPLFSSTSPNVRITAPSFHATSTATSSSFNGGLLSRASSTFTGDLRVATGSALLLNLAEGTKQSVGGGGPESLSNQKSAGNSLFIWSGLNTDTEGRWLVETNGLMGWGAGDANDQDTNLFRNATGSLAVQSFTDDSTQTFRVNDMAGNSVFTVNSVSDYITTPQILVNGAGGGAKLDVFGDGSTAIRAQNTNASDVAFSSFVTGDAQLRFTFFGNGQLNWGDGSSVVDTNLYRFADNVLQTDDAFNVLGTTTLATTTIKNLTVTDAFNADTATALAANGSNCTAGSYALGVDASGAAEGCTDATTEIDSAITTHAGVADAHQDLVTLAGTPDYITLAGQVLTRNTIDIGDDTNLVGGNAITLSGDTLNFDGGASPGGELGGTWASPTIDDSLAVSSWNLTTPTFTTNFTFDSVTVTGLSGIDTTVITGTAGTSGNCVEWDANGDIVDAGAACGTGGGGGGTLSTTTDKIMAGAAGTVSYVTDEFMLGGSSSTTSEFLFDYASSTMEIRGAGTTSVLSTGAEEAVRIGEADQNSDDGWDLVTGLEFVFNSATVTLRGVGSTVATAITTALNWTYTGTIDFTGATVNFGAGAIDTITEIATGLKSGVDATLITGTEGTNGNLGQWNADGDLVDSSLATADVVTGASTDTFTNKTFDANGTGNSISNVDLTADVTGTLSAGSYGAATIDGDDINSNIAGRSLTLTSASPDTLDADTELYTQYTRIQIASTTVDTALVDLASGTTTWYAGNINGAHTVASIYCKTDQGTAIARIGDGTNWTEQITCNSTGAEDASLSNNTFTDREDLVIEIGTSATNPNRVTFTAESQLGD